MKEVGLFCIKVDCESFVLLFGEVLEQFMTEKVVENFQILLIFSQSVSDN